MLTEKEIEQRLQGVDHKLRAVVAARCALRVLPLLIHNNNNKRVNFSYWKKTERSKHLLAVWNALRYAVNADAAANAAFATNATNAAADTANAAAFAAFAADAAFAANAAARAAFDIQQTTITIAIELDLQRIQSPSQTKQILSAQQFAALPLWSEDVPDDWQQLYQRFKQAVLDLNEGFEHWLVWYEDRVKGVPLDQDVEKKWFSIPEEVKKQGAKATNAYFMSLFAPALSPLNLVRAIFIGDGAVGKTSLIRRLHGEPVTEGNETMTAGIEIKQWALPDSTIKARFWDFGGQVMSHSMHQFFLRERCLYILLVDAGSEREKRERLTANDRAEYWLEHIKAFGNAAPVMLVGNKADKASVNLDMNALREKYPNILDFYPISCTATEQGYLNRFQTFHDDLVENLKRVDTHQVMFTDKQFTMLQTLRERARNSAFLDYEAFDTLCIEHEIGKVGLDKTAFLGLLDSLGEIVHFPDLAWSEAYVLNPRWLTYGVYTLLYADKTEQQLGLLSDNDVQEYPASRTGC